MHTKYLTALFLHGLAQIAAAQVYTLPAATRSSLYNLGAGNNDIPNFQVSTIVGASDPEGGFVSNAGSQTFQGLNNDSNLDEFIFSGSGSAVSQFGILRTEASGKITNNFYNAANPNYYNSTTFEVNPDGTPDRLVSFAQAQFSDELIYNANSSSTPSAAFVRFAFHIDGELRGSSSVFSIFVEVDNDSDTFAAFGSDATTTSLNQDFFTKQFAIGADSQVILTATIVSQFDNGTTADDALGSTVEASASFFNTAYVDGIEYFDADGNPLSDYSISTLSGTDYSNVPEPGTWCLLAMGLLAVAGRWRYQRRRLPLNLPRLR